MPPFIKIYLQVSPFKTALIWLLVLQSASLWAQEPPAVDPEAPLFTLDFRTLGWDAPVSGIFFFDGSEKKDLVASVSRPSRPKRYTGPNPLVFYRAGPPVEPGAPPSLQPVASLDLRSLDSRQLLLFVPTSNQSEGLEFLVRALPDPLEEAVGGSLRLINLTRSELAAKVNETTVRLDPGEIGSIMAEPRSDNSLGMRVAARKAESWELVFSTVLGFRPNQRVSLFITEDNNGRTRFHRITEVIRAKTSRL